MLNTNFYVTLLLKSGFGRLSVEDHTSHTDRCSILNLALGLGERLSSTFGHFACGKTGTDINRLRYEVSFIGHDAR